MLKQISDIVLEAGCIVKEGFYSAKNINHKGEVDLVTDFDIRTENFLKEKLQKVFPSFTIVGEETSAEGSCPAENVIFIDPIDGTTNFVHGVPFVAVSVGVITDSETKYGVVYNPILDELYSAETGKGAFCNGSPLKVSDNASLINSLVATGFPYKKDNLPYLMKVLEEVLKSTQGIRRAGAASLDLCYTAKGIYDLYYETRLQPWDMAGGIIIVREAGGIVTKLDGRYHDMDDDSLIASNGLIHKEFLNILNEIK
ncbi:MAG: inositol monophosphatase family protein [Candidatus Mucispirillum faecigallinarum]|nr:inositol monophosphatase family protein [Candidatus Mucispirillum faecigallinarum]